MARNAAWPAARWLPRIIVAWAVLATSPGCLSSAFLLGVDLGSQFFKVAIVAPGKSFEIVHNQHSKRKTPTAVSFLEKVRTFGDDAVASATRGAAKTPMLFPLQLGRNLTGAAGTSLPWVPANFYPMDLSASDTGLQFGIGEDRFSIQEITAHILRFAGELAETEIGLKASETILLVPSRATFLQRRALLDAAEIAKLPRPHLLHETSAAALQRALDLDLSGVNGTQNTSTVLFYNMGALHTEACIVAYTGTTHMGKPTVAMDVLGCGMEEVGGHHVDLTIAAHMLEAFKAKNPKLAAGIGSSTRALKKLMKEAMAMKHVLSANKDAQFRVESLYEDTDFTQPVSRETMEAWCEGLFQKVSEPIKSALLEADLPLTAVDTVEMIGGGWRIPKVQALLSEYLQSTLPEGAPALNLSQHVNGDEAMATGASFYGANTSTSFRTKKIFFSDVSPHSYVLTLAPLEPQEGDWPRVVELFPARSKLRSKKTVKATVTFALRATLAENGNTIATWDIPVQDAMANHTNLGSPLVSLKFELDSSGVVQLYSSLAIFDELVPEPAAGASLLSSKRGEETATNAEGASTEEPADSATQEGESEETPPAAEELNATSASNASTVLKPKKRKVTVKPIARESSAPRPMSVEEKLEAIVRLDAMDSSDADVKKLEAAKNSLESFCYESRAKVQDDENCQEVSTEEERAAVVEMSTALEEWLYEDEAAQATVSVFEEKLAGLHEKVDPILSRAFELEQRALLPDLIQQVRDYFNRTLDYVEKNMSWVDAKEREGVANISTAFEAWYANVTEQQSKLKLTDNPAYTARQVKMGLNRLGREAQRLTKIKYIEPMPYRDKDPYGGFGYNDPRMRAYYEAMMKNKSWSFNGSRGFNNSSNFSGFQGWNDSEYFRSYYEHFAKNFSKENESTADDGPSSERENDSEKPEL
mmetsp:Transcript_8046/g.17455  ORF Transcript_8046/g.17455 Transcript_8046/m.17455 type:complete len:932 (+) Transcript_8046:64-2859(+)